MNTPTNESSPRNRPPTARRKIGLAIIYALLALICAAIGAYYYNNTLIFILSFLPAFILARLSFRHFKRRFTGNISEVVHSDEAPVLFLRPFDKDAGWDGAAAFSVYRPRTWRKFPFSPTNMRALYLEMTGRASFEQVLAYVARKIGPLVAIGEPGSPPILGARNLYVGDDNWQEQVLDLARKSRLVILTAGISPGVLWEVRTMINEVQPERLLLNIPGAAGSEREENYSRFFKAAHGYFPVGLSETIKRGRFLIFDNAWHPQIGIIRKPVKNSPAWVAKQLTRLLV